jgi:hypothetical protein
MENDHPVCPYCHGAVEEKRTRHPEGLQMDAVARWGDLGEDVFAKASEQSVDRIFEIMAKSIENSPYFEYKDDILRIVKDAFEPLSRLAQADIARIFIDSCSRADAEADRRVIQSSISI